MSRIKWRGEDGAGYQYGFYRDPSGTEIRVDIAIPGKGLGMKHPGPGYDVYIEGEKVGSEANENDAIKFAERYLKEDRHKAQDQVRRRSR